jgi:hypothetical protein
MIYDPQPIPTNGIELPESLTPLIEKLAESVHDNWANCRRRQRFAIVRIDQGWTYGQIRDDNVKTHPALVPYAELSESEKDIDRRIVVQTLKSIYAFGYDIVRVS